MRTGIAELPCGVGNDDCPLIFPARTLRVVPGEQNGDACGLQEGSTGQGGQKPQGKSVQNTGVCKSCTCSTGVMTAVQ